MVQKYYNYDMLGINMEVINMLGRIPTEEELLSIMCVSDFEDVRGFINTINELQI